MKHSKWSISGLVVILIAMMFPYIGEARTDNGVTDIYTAEELDNIRNDLSGDYRLMKDIDLSGYANWEPIGTNLYPFTGTLDGNGHTISNLTIDRDDVAGLFSVISGATIKNVGLNNGEVQGSCSVGGLVGYAEFSSLIEKSYATLTVSGNCNVGGLAGQIIYSSSIKQSYATGAVSGDSHTGGLVGTVYGGSTTKNSYWDMDTSGQTSSAGGEGKSTEDMQKKTTFKGWDFANTWIMTDGETYPTFRPGPNNAALKNLTLSEGELSPEFDPNTSKYTANVGHNIHSITVTPTVSYSAATVVVNGNTVTSGNASDPIDLEVGDNQIQAIVTAQDGTTTRTYSIMVDRVPAPPVIHAPTGWTNNNTVIITRGSDEGSSVAKTKYKIGDGDWQSFTGASKEITIKDEGEITIRAQAVDHTGNISKTAEQTVKIDRTAPEITLLGDNPLTLEAGSTYEDPGSTAKDNVDGEIGSDQVEITGDVDTTKLGTYEIHYNVSDNQGNEAFEAIRKVHVIAPEVIKLELDHPAVSVYPGSLVKVEDTDTTIQLPNDLPEGTTLQVKTTDLSVEGFDQQGEVYQFIFTYPEGQGNYTGDFILTLGVNSNAKHAAIYYYNPETKTLEKVGGEQRDGIITTKVEHLSIYGVYSPKKEEAEAIPPKVEKVTPPKEVDKSGPLPETSIHMYTWLAVGMLLVLIGGILMFLRLKKNTRQTK